MNIALIADNHKKELMAQFCIAYCGILSRHNLFATHITGKLISDATGLELETFFSGGSGGIDQIASVVQTNSATAEQSATASEELSSQANVVKEMVAKFQLREENEAFIAAGGFMPLAPVQSESSGFAASGSFGDKY